MAYIVVTGVHAHVLSSTLLEGTDTRHRAGLQVRIPNRQQEGRSNNKCQHEFHRSVCRGYHRV